MEPGLDGSVVRVMPLFRGVSDSEDYFGIGICGKEFLGEDDGGDVCQGAKLSQKPVPATGGDGDLGFVFVFEAGGP